MKEEAPNQRLDSWKEIAEYLGRDVRTAIRWEKERDLPVHRVPGGVRQAVFAYSAEIDSWMNGQPADGLESPAATTPTSAPNSEPAQPEPPLTPVANATAAAAELNRPLRNAQVAIAVLALVVVIVAGMRMFQVQIDRQAERINLTDNKLVAWNSKGQPAWEYPFTDSVYTYYPQISSRLTRFVDLRGDGQREILTVVGFNPPTGMSHTPHSVVYCFSLTGKLLWKYDPQVSFRFGGREYEGPWLVRDLLVSPDAKNRTIWVAFCHNTWWPSFVSKIDAMGGASVQFVNSGHVFALDYVRNSNGGFLLAGGIDNETKSASLAVIPEDMPFSTSPHAGDSPYRCESCQVARPSAYFLFPRSDVADAEDLPFQYVNAIEVQGDRIVVQTFEGQNQANGALVVPGFYELSKDFDLESISFGDVYWGVHRELERKGKIHHSADKCPDRLHPNRVRRWTPDQDWVQPPLLSNRAKN
jgi:hypothetical protein